MRALKVKVKTLDWDRGFVILSGRDAATIMKHEYRYIQICGKEFSLGNRKLNLDGTPLQLDLKGRKPLVRIEGSQVTEHLRNVGLANYY